MSQVNILRPDFTYFSGGAYGDWRKGFAAGSHRAPGAPHRAPGGPGLPWGSQVPRAPVAVVRALPSLRLKARCWCGGGVRLPGADTRRFGNVGFLMKQ